MAGERNSNTPAAQGAAQQLDRFKYEVANEMGLQLGGDRTSRENGSVGGQMTKRMIQFAEEHLKGGSKL
ncbi:alpha/beta-type small acid-soluble spore protein [Desulfosporosinus sp. BICA1-9]|uniref:alpha/beta-type small acid-soluble spore protein n=1 Tax=Desulfosporosinus sp. BICA1-9 TaxID=1531958 RepID=UPI00054B71CB|nr:alpha/beta-type small acid-soluble spore protein [Desulfosporosinus sp. BICA1-9]KJS49538.1 MAG: spore protein [Peptococcaceae bacterium BRH_c23]KJS78582.1 MAG: spore protein [Desulfosporosinus sp. BICA1-9]HBW36784.1 small acid-soluble spore protein [Desulfosporosinus sp.]